MHYAGNKRLEDLQGEVSWAVERIRLLEDVADAARSLARAHLAQLAYGFPGLDEQGLADRIVEQLKKLDGGEIRQF